jgi:hypothetical protein
MIFIKTFDPADPNAPTAAEFVKAIDGLTQNGKNGTAFMILAIVLAPLAIYGVYKFFKK